MVSDGKELARHNIPHSPFQEPSSGDGKGDIEEGTDHLMLIVMRKMK